MDQEMASQRRRLVKGSSGSRSATAAPFWSLKLNDSVEQRELLEGIAATDRRRAETRARRRHGRKREGEIQERTHRRIAGDAGLG